MRLATSDGALDQAAQVGSVAVQVAENEQPAHMPSLPRACSGSQATPGAGAFKIACLPRMKAPLLGVRREVVGIVAIER